MGTRRKLVDASTSTIAVLSDTLFFKLSASSLRRARMRVQYSLLCVSVRSTCAMVRKNWLKNCPRTSFVDALESLHEQVQKGVFCRGMSLRCFAGLRHQ